MGAELMTREHRLPLLHDQLFRRTVALRANFWLNKGNMRTNTFVSHGLMRGGEEIADKATVVHRLQQSSDEDAFQCRHSAR